MNAAFFETYIKKHIPIAWAAGVRFESYADPVLQTAVQLDVMNQNPFGSMFWAVEGMAAEFAGGMMLLLKIEAAQQNIASLIIKNEAAFYKKALGKITFTCKDGRLIDTAIQNAISNQTAQELVLTTVATDETDDIVAQFQFTWSIKIRV
jgi:acyl-coenzyme A thioesterase PaaI-like protein